MSPNAIGNAQALQTAQLEELKEKLRVKGEVHKVTIAHLKDAISLAESDDADGIIINAIRHLAHAQLVLAEYTVNEINFQMANLDEAIAKSKSPIARATLIR
jgi:hypothetical protein